MPQETFIPLEGSTHLEARNIYNANAYDAEVRLTALESGSGGGAVFSVNAQTGVVVLDADNISDATTTNKFATQAQLDNADSALQPSDPTLESITTNGATTLNNISVGRIQTLHPTNSANDNTAAGNQACAIGGIQNVVSGNRSVSYGGRENEVIGNDSSTIGGFGQIVRGQEAEGLGSTDTTLNTKYTTAIGTINSVVGLGSQGTSSNASKHSSVLGGDTNIIESATEAVIVGGTTNTIQSTHHRSVILGGQNITTDAADTAYVPNLNVGAGFKMPTGATDTYVLTSDANGVGTWQSNSGGGAPQIVTSSGGLLTWDHNLGSTIKVSLTEDVTSVSISNAVEGDSGMILVQQGGASPFAFGGSSLRTLSGDLSVIASDMPAASYVCTIGWYYDGSLIYVYVSDTSITSL